MELTNKIIEDLGFERINNSMWRDGNITLQNAHTSSGNIIIERLLSVKKAYKVCIDGKFKCNVSHVIELALVCSKSERTTKVSKDLTPLKNN